MVLCKSTIIRVIVSTPKAGYRVFSVGVSSLTILLQFVRKLRDYFPRSTERKYSSPLKVRSNYNANQILRQIIQELAVNTVGTLQC